MTPTHDELVRDNAAIGALLARLRRQLRTYLWLYGIAAAIVVLGVSFWVSLAIDYWQEPGPGVRLGLLALAAIAFLAVLFVYLGRRAFVRLNDRSLALVLERRFQQFDDSLITAVELAGRPHPDEPYGAALLEHSRAAAAERAAATDTAAVFNYRPLYRAIVAALVLVISIGMFAVAAPEALALWSRRSFLLSSELWPRSTHLAIEGFDNGRVKVARGSDLQLTVKADASMEIPEVVEVRLRSEDGSLRRENMVREGVADPARDDYQFFSHTIAGVLAPLELEIVGGDDRLRGLHIDVVESPAITGMTVFVEYPRYMVRPDLGLYTPRELPVTEFMQLPLGSRVTVRAKANKELVEVAVSYRQDESTDVSRTVELSSKPAGQPRREFEFTLEELNGDKTLLFTLLDRDGLRNREPVRLSIGARPDEPPQVAVRLQGIGTAITKAARLPIAGQITDDYGVAEAWFEYSVDEGQPARRPLRAKLRGRVEATLDAQNDEAFDARDELQLAPGQKLLITVKASDQYDLQHEPHVGSAQRYLLDVVTPEQLRLLLEGRELNLRRRFETIIDEVTRTRESLSAVAFEGKASGQEATDEDESLDSPASLASLHVQRAMQNARKNAQETLGVATSFDEIREELVNNRLDTEELKGRLKDKISDPLKKIVDERFAELEKRLSHLQENLSNEQGGPEALAQAQQQFDVIIVEMQQVLSQMLELETFNEAIALLRSIMESQEKVHEKTKQKRKSILFE
jgi:hypothetical protein